MRQIVIVESNAECERLMLANGKMFGEHVLQGAHREHMVFRAHEGIVIMTKFTGYENPADNGYRAVVLSHDATMEELREVFEVVTNHGWSGEPGVITMISDPEPVNQ